VNGYSSSKVVQITRADAPLDFGTLDGKLMFDYNDVAIFTLARNVSEVTGQIEYLAITTNSPPVGSKLTVAGYGQLATDQGTSLAHYGTITVAPDNLCQFDSYQKSVSFCTYDLDAYTCPGDSGSPIVFKPPSYSRYVAVGLNSYGHEGDCSSKQPDSVMTRLSAMTNFIREKTTLAPPTFVAVDYPAVTAAPAPSNCWTCPSGSAHWWEFNLSGPLDGDNCQCIEGTASPQTSAPSVAPGTDVVRYDTPSPTDNTTSTPRSSSTVVRSSLVNIALGVFVLFALM